MRFGGYILEILVNDIPLPERPVKVETDYINFEPSYYVDDTTKRKIFCDMHYIVEVITPKSEFKIRFRSLQVSKSRIIRGDIEVNGKSDQTCIELYNKSFQIVTGFWNKKKIHKPFKFSTTTNNNNNNHNNSNNNNNNNDNNNYMNNNYYNKNNKFNIKFNNNNNNGVISVYFYEIERLRYPTVKNLKIGSENYKDLFWSGSSRLKSYEPIAVLHVHYRSTSWFNNILNNNNNNNNNNSNNNSNGGNSNNNNNNNSNQDQQVVEEEETPLIGKNSLAEILINRLQKRMSL